MKDIGKRLPVLTEHLIADVGQADNADERRTRMCTHDVEVVAQRRKSRFQLERDRNRDVG
jgi:hypothetical protein